MRSIKDYMPLFTSNSGRLQPKNQQQLDPTSSWHRLKSSKLRSKLREFVKETHAARGPGACNEPADAPSPSLLIHLLEGGGGAAE